MIERDGMKGRVRRRATTLTDAVTPIVRDGSSPLEGFNREAGSPLRLVNGLLRHSPGGWWSSSSSRRVWRMARAMSATRMCSLGAWKQQPL